MSSSMAHLSEGNTRGDDHRRFDDDRFSQSRDANYTISETLQQIAYRVALSFISRIGPGPIDRERSSRVFTRDSAWRLRKLRKLRRVSQRSSFTNVDSLNRSIVPLKSTNRDSRSEDSTNSCWRLIDRSSWPELVKLSPSRSGWGMLPTALPKVPFARWNCTLMGYGNDLLNAVLYPFLWLNS